MPDGMRYTRTPWVIAWSMNGRSYGAWVPRKLREREMEGMSHLGESGMEVGISHRRWLPPKRGNSKI